MRRARNLGPRSAEERLIFAAEGAMVDASEAIAAALEASGLTQAALARQLGVARSEISERLAGERNITVRRLAETLEALDHELVLQARPRVENRDALRAKYRTPRAIEAIHHHPDEVRPVSGWRSIEPTQLHAMDSQS